MRNLRNILGSYYIWLLVGSLLLVACSPGASAPSGGPATAAPSQPKAGGILNTGEPRDIINLDTWRTGSIQDLDKTAPSMSGIVQYDPLEHEKIVGDLAERWEISPDGKVYTFYFHKNVKWHDGQPFSAEDVKYTLDRAVNPPKGITISRQRFFSGIDKMEVLDKDTLRITLKNPQPDILALLAMGWHLMLPKHILEPKGGDMQNKVVGTGPYKFVDYTVGVSYTVTKNPDYFKPGRPYLDGVKQYILTDDNARFAALRAKQIDLVFNFPGITPKQADALEQAYKDIVVVRTPTLVGSPETVALNINTKPLSDVRVRQALSMAIDRRQGIKLPRQGLGRLGGPMPPFGNWGLPEAELFKRPGWREDKAQDIAEAKKLLADAGYGNGFKLVNLVRTGQTDEDMAIFLKQEFAKIGVELELKLVESAVRTDLSNRGEFDTLNGVGSLATDTPDETFLGVYYGPATNQFKLKDETLDRMIEAQSRELDVAKRKALVWDIQRRILDTVPNIVTGTWPIYPAAFWNYVKDWKNPPAGYNNLKFQDVWLAK